MTESTILIVTPTPVPARSITCSREEHTDRQIAMDTVSATKTRRLRWWGPVLPAGTHTERHVATLHPTIPADRNSVVRVHHDHDRPFGPTLLAVPLTPVGLAVRLANEWLLAPLFAEWVTIPATPTPATHLTGYSALNVHPRWSPTGGDWHGASAWTVPRRLRHQHPARIALGTLWTELGAEGVYDARAELHELGYPPWRLRKPVWCADHVRAFLDMAADHLEAIATGEHPPPDRIFPGADQVDQCLDSRERLIAQADRLARLDTRGLDWTRWKRELESDPDRTRYALSGAFAPDGSVTTDATTA